MEHVNTFKQTCSHWKVAQRQEVALKVDNSMVVIFGFSPFSDYETLKCVIVRAAVFGVLNAQLIIKPTQRRLVIFVKPVI